MCKPGSLQLGTPLPTISGQGFLEMDRIGRRRRNIGYIPTEFSYQPSSVYEANQKSYISSICYVELLMHVEAYTVGYNVVEPVAMVTVATP